MSPLPSTHQGALRKRPGPIVALIGLLSLALAGAPACAHRPDTEEVRVDAVNLLDAAQNSIEDGRPGTPPSGWVSQGNADIARSGAFAAIGEASMRVVDSLQDPVYVDASRTIRVGTSPATDGVPVQEGHVYAGSLEVTSPTESSPVRCELRWYDENGAIVRTDPGEEVTEVPSEWTRAGCTAPAPDGAAYAALRVHIRDADLGDTHYVDDAWLVDNTDGGDDTATTTPEPSTPEPPTAPQPPASSTPEAPTAPRPSGVPDLGTPVVGAPTEQSTGPAVANPQRVGTVEVSDGQSVTLTDVIADRLVVHGGGQLTATRVRVEGAVVVVPQVGVAPSKLHLTDSAVTSGMTVNASDSRGNLYWSGNVPVDIVVSGSWIHHPHGSGPSHTEALAGFGWPTGARFIHSTFIQDGPHNDTATATINWHGTNSLFDGCYFGWANSTAAYFTIYVEGNGNTVRNSALEIGLADYVFPDSSPRATYTGNTDATSGALLAL